MEYRDVLLMGDKVKSQDADIKKKKAKRRKQLKVLEQWLHSDLRWQEGTQCVGCGILKVAAIK